MFVLLLILSVVLNVCRCQYVQLPIQAFTQNEVTERLSKTCRDRNIRIIADYEGLFYMAVKIGDPPQLFNVLIDTNTHPLWVPSNNSTELFTGCGIKMHEQYNPLKSQTSEYDARTFRLKYPEGLFRGNYMKDTVKVGPTRIKDQVFGLLQYTNSHHYHVAPFDGVFGLNFLQSDSDPFSPIYNMFRLELIDEKLFAIYINNSEINPLEGFLIFGGVPNDLNTGNLAYYGLRKKGKFSDWRLAVEGIYINNKDTCFADCEVLFVSSSKYIYAPEHTSYIMNVELGAAIKTYRFPEHGEFWQVPCGLLHLNITSPLVIKIDGDNYGIQPENLISSFHVGSYRVCTSNIRDALNVDHIKLGIPFFKQFFTVFDMNKVIEKRKIGIASY